MKDQRIYRSAAKNLFVGRTSLSVPQFTDKPKASGERELARSGTRPEFRWSAQSLGDFRYGGYELTCRSPQVTVGDLDKPHYWVSP
jgi:hypothetical protein